MFVWNNSAIWNSSELTWNLEFPIFSSLECTIWKIFFLLIPQISEFWCQTILESLLPLWAALVYRLYTTYHRHGAWDPKNQADKRKNVNRFQKEPPYFYKLVFNFANSLIMISTIKSQIMTVLPLVALILCITPIKGKQNCYLLYEFIENKTFVTRRVLLFHMTFVEIKKCNQKLFSFYDFAWFHVNYVLSTCARYGLLGFRDFKVGIAKLVFKEFIWNKRI